VVNARDGSPAARAGLKAGDLITHADGRSVGDLPYLIMTHAVLEGVEGTSVRLTVERSGIDQRPEDVTLERSVAFGIDVSIEQVAPGIARIRIASLTDQTAAALAASWEAYANDRSAAHVTRGVVLDLRSTAADSPDGAREVADAFLQSGPTLRTISRREGEQRQETAVPGDLTEGRPIVVLVDGGTAGPAEMLASALQEGRRARVLGTKTAGRGALRTLISLDQRGRKGLLRLTTGRLVTPAGAAIDGKGITPDVIVEQLPDEQRCRPRDIEGAQSPGVCVPRVVAQDTQLQRAISMLGEPIVAAKQGPDSAKP
jgi:carboxyl-terminal processing protease